MVHGLTLEREGVRLAAVDFGGAGPPVLLLHGLGGHTGEWKDTAAWLTATHRVVALDERGHGRSERRPDDVSLDARVADVVFAIDQLELAPATLIGQSLGAITAGLATWPDPQFDLDVMELTLRASLGRSFWPDSRAPATTSTWTARPAGAPR